MVAQSRAAEGVSGLPDGGLFPILSRSRNQDAALSPFQTNGGLFGSLGWAVGDALHGRDLDEGWYKVGPPIPPPVFPGPNGRGDANPPHRPQTATPLGVNVGSLARADQPSDQLWESVSIPLAQAQFPFEVGASRSQLRERALMQRSATRCMTAISSTAGWSVCLPVMRRPIYALRIVSQASKSRPSVTERRTSAWIVVPLVSAENQWHLGACSLKEMQLCLSLSDV